MAHGHNPYNLTLGSSHTLAIGNTNLEILGAGSHKDHVINNEGVEIKLNVIVLHKIYIILIETHGHGSELISSLNQCAAQL